MSFPQAPSHARSTARCFCLAGTSSRGPWKYRVVNAKLLEECSRQRARVVDALEKRINLNGSLQPTQGLLHCSLDLPLSPSASLSFSCSSFRVLRILNNDFLDSSWPQSWPCWTRFQHRTSLLGGDGGVTLVELCSHATSILLTHGQRSHVP